MILIKFVYIWRTEFARIYYTNTVGVKKKKKKEFQD